MADVTLDTLVQAILSLRTSIQTMARSQGDKIDQLAAAHHELSRKVETLTGAVQSTAKPMADLAETEATERSVQIEAAKAKAQIDIETARARTEAIKAVFSSPVAWAVAVATLVLAVAQATRGMPIDVIPTLSNLGVSP